MPYSERIKKEANINTMAVGAIIEPDQAEDIVTNGRADLIAIGRELLLTRNGFIKRYKVWFI